MGDNFKKKLMQEIEPILIHMVCGLIIVCGIAIFGVGVLLLERIFPEEKESFHWMKMMDIYAMQALVCLFSAFLVTRIAMRLLKALKKDSVDELTPD